MSPLVNNFPIHNTVIHHGKQMPPPSIKCLDHVNTKMYTENAFAKMMIQSVSVILVLLCIAGEITRPHFCGGTSCILEIDVKQKARGVFIGLVTGHHFNVHTHQCHQSRC